MLSSERKPAKPLTRREREIAGLVAEGLTNREIARKLFISERTAEGHVEQIRNKLGFTSRSQVAAWATQNLATQPESAKDLRPQAEPPLSVAKSKPQPAFPWPADLHWPFGVAGGLGVILLAVAVFAAGMFLIFRFSPATGTLVVSTYAGTGVGGFLGDGGQAVDAELSRTTGIAIDPASGAIYIIDGNRVRRILGGSIDTVVGSGSSGAIPLDNTASTAANLNLIDQYPPNAQGIAVDSQGNVYLADSHDHIVWRATKGRSGTISRFAGTGVAGTEGDGQLATSSELEGPSGLAFDSHDNLYIADSVAGNVREVSNGVISTLPLGGLQLQDPHGLALDHQGNLYIADTSNHRVIRVTPDGDISSFALNLPVALAVDSQDRLYVADGNRIRRIATTGVITNFAGNGTAGFNGDGGLPVHASLSRPLGVAIDAVDNVFVVDSGNNRIRVITKR